MTTDKDFEGWTISEVGLEGLAYQHKWIGGLRSEHMVCELRIDSP
jgi:hypothetical protein